MRSYTCSESREVRPLYNPGESAPHDLQPLKSTWTFEISDGVFCLTYRWPFSEHVQEFRDLLQQMILERDLPPKQQKKTHKLHALFGSEVMSHTQHEGYARYENSFYSFMTPHEGGSILLQYQDQHDKAQDLD